MMCIKEKFDFNESIKEVLELHACDRDSVHDAFLFLGFASDGKGGGLTVSTAGDRRALLQAFLQAFDNDEAPHYIRAALYFLVANMLSEEGVDFEAVDIGYRLGMWAERKFGKTECNCERCQAAKN